MSHEIRTPLNAIIGYGEVLQEEAEDAGDEVLRADIARILDAGRYLTRLINMILDLSKIDAGRMTFDVRAHSMVALLDEAVAACRREWGAVAIDVVVEVDQVEVDRTRLLQVLGAILDNAAQYGAGGPIMIMARARIEDGREAVVLTVRDAGPGICSGVLPTLFDPSSSSREASDGRYGGTGLSLALCSELCRAMGGHLSAESALGHGSTFTVSLPRRSRSDMRDAGMARLEAA
jgi:signal transduction histidine kinase